MESRGAAHNSRMNSDDEAMVDRHGVPADLTIFFDKMPPHFTQENLEALIAQAGGGTDQLVNVWFGTKPLEPGEHRTATAKFQSIDAAVRCRSLLQHYREEVSAGQYNSTPVALLVEHRAACHIFYHRAPSTTYKCAARVLLV